MNGIYLGLLGTKLLDLNFDKTKPKYPNVEVDPVYPSASGSVSLPGFNAYGPQVDLPGIDLNYPEVQVGVPSVEVGPITSDWPWNYKITSDLEIWPDEILILLIMITKW